MQELSVSGLPSSLPGVDVASGLARVAGNAKLYLKLLRQIAADAPGIKERISTAVMNGDARAVRDVAHSLKGAAGNLSITEVANAATQLELAAKNEDFSSMFGHLDNLEKMLQEFVAVIEGLEE